MGTLSYPFTLTAGQPENVNQLNSNLAAIATVLNGNVDATNLASGAVDVAELASALAVVLGVTQSGVVRRGKSIIATEGTRTNVAYGALSDGPDEVANVVLPTDGFICVAYQANWKSSVTAAGSAAIFLNADQLKIADTGGAAPVVAGAEATSNGTTANTYKPLASRTGKGLEGPSGATGYTGDVTTGQVQGFTGGVGGPVYIFAAAGTYDVSIQFKSTSGSVTVKERKLWVWTIGL